MNAINDPTLTRETRKGLWMFLWSERIRHLEDVKQISYMLNRLEIETGLTDEERYKLIGQARKYVSFKEVV